MTVLGCSFALAGSQIVPLLYLTLGTTIAHDLDAPNLLVWMLSAGVVSAGAIAPFVGPLSDLIGRKSLLIIGIVTSAVGAVICAATPNIAGFIVGQVLLGFGVIIEELLAISVVAEIVPTSKRPLYAALNLCAIIPWSPGTLYANWIAITSWRWIGCTLAIWNVITVTIIAWFYRPPPQVNALGLTRREILSRIDFLGGFLITAGLVLLLVGLNSGGQDYPWHSAYVISFLVVGISLMIAFVIWEMFGTKYPMFPRRIIQAPRPFFCMLFVIFAAGINYVPLVAFWPIQSIGVYQADHWQNGVNTLPIGTCILAGAILSAILLGLFKRHVTFTMTTFCVMQTVGELITYYFTALQPALNNLLTSV
jgi:MFS family permease